MSEFVCKRNVDVDVNDLETQICDETNVYQTIFPHKCCACGNVCRRYIKIYKKEDRWTIAKEEENPEDACIIGICCFDPKEKKIKSKKRERIENLKQEMEELERSLQTKRVKLQELKE